MIVSQGNPALLIYITAVALSKNGIKFSKKGMVGKNPHLTLWLVCLGLPTASVRLGSIP